MQYLRHSPSHPQTYPSQHLPHAQPLVEHIARMVEPPSLPDEPIHSGHDGDFHRSTTQLHHGGSTHQHLPPHPRAHRLIHCAGAPSPLHSLPLPWNPGPHSMPPMPTTTCQLSSMCLLPRQTCKCATLGSRRGFPRWHPRRGPRSRCR